MKTEPSPTQGPWIIKHRSVGYLDIEIGVTRIATLDLCNTDPSYTQEEATANAVLISSAPELLSALEGLVIGLSFGRFGAQLKPQIENAINAIAKARGEL
jgi:hypothetical protein